MEAEVELLIPPPSGLGSQILNLKHVGMELGGRKLFTDLDLLFDKKRNSGPPYLAFEPLAAPISHESVV